MSVIFVAGASGAVGRTVLRLATQAIDLRPHYRKQPERDPHPNAVIFPLEDGPRLADAMRDCTTVVQLIGTMRKRFAAGDTYETSDIGTTAQLVEAAKLSPSVKHFVLLSSIGAGRPTGAYLKAKARAEALVTDSGLPFTILRPSAFEGEGHHVPGLALLTRLPGLSRYRPILVTDLARTILYVAGQRAPLGAVLEGESLAVQVRASLR